MLLKLWLCLAQYAEKLSRKTLEELEAHAKTFGAKGMAWLKRSPEGLTGPIAKFLSDDEKLSLSQISQEGDTLLIIADKWKSRKCCPGCSSLKTWTGFRVDGSR